jgi:hypothetical protein
MVDNPVSLNQPADCFFFVCAIIGIKLYAWLMQPADADENNMSTLTLRY